MAPEIAIIFNWASVHPSDQGTSPALTHQNIEQSIELLQQNKGLEDVFLDHAEFFEARREESLFKALAGLKCLRKLDIKALRNVTESMEFLLENLPLLKTLITDQWEISELIGVINMLPRSRSVGSDLNLGSRKHLQLTELRTSCVELDSECFPPILAVLRVSPLLEVLEIASSKTYWMNGPPSDIPITQALAKILHETCPRLQELVFLNIAMDHHGLRTLLQFQTQDTLGTSMATTHWLSLRVLQLNQVDISEEDTLQILESGVDASKTLLRSFR